MTQEHDAETVERVAKSMWDVSDKSSDWQDAGEHLAEIYRHRARAALSAMPAREVTVQEAARVLLDNCPNPIFDNLKYPLMGEFSQRYPFLNEDGDEVFANVNISWTVTKDIIATAIRALSGDKP